MHVLEVICKWKNTLRYTHKVTSASSIEFSLTGNCRVQFYKNYIAHKHVHYHSFKFI